MSSIATAFGGPVAGVTLVDVIAPLDAQTFYERHWGRGGAPYLSLPSPPLVEKLRSVESLASVHALLERMSGDVMLFGPGATRTAVPAAAARDALAAGSNLYISNVEAVAPEAGDLFRDVGAALGLAPWQLSVEAFAGRAGGVSSRHYDHDINFQILLDGEKEWKLESNRNIANPLRPYHPISKAGTWDTFGEEAYATDPLIAAGFEPSRALTLRAAAGTVLYLPRGTWHETLSRTDTWALNIVVAGVTWADALGRALVARLHRSDRLREYCHGYGARTLSAAQEVERRETFETLVREASRALSELPLAEVVLSPLGSQRCAWRAEAVERRVQRRGSAGALVVPGLLPEPLPIREDLVRATEVLCAFCHPFDFAHARAALPDVAAETIYGLIAGLAKRRLLDVRPPDRKK